MAEIVTDDLRDGRTVFTVNVFEVAPAATVIVVGTEAMEGLELTSFTTPPPAGAGAVSFTVPVDDVPPLTPVGLRESVASAAVEGGAGVTLRIVVLVTPL